LEVGKGSLMPVWRMEAGSWWNIQFPHPTLIFNKQKTGILTQSPISIFLTLPIGEKMYYNYLVKGRK